MFPHLYFVTLDILNMFYWKKIVPNIHSVDKENKFHVLYTIEKNNYSYSTLIRF
jgi:hypothetical protein